MSEQHRQHFRAQFPALANKTYFNYGGEGPLSQTARDAILQSYDRLQQMGPFSLNANVWVQECAQTLRGAIATELGVAPETVAVTEDVTAGCNVALWGIDWKPGDALLMTDCEHPGVIATVRELQHRFNIEVSVCPILDTLNEGDPVEVISRYLTPKTRLVVLSHILWNTGQVLPLADIVTACRGVSTESGQPIRVLADAAQSVGVLPLKLGEAGVDFYAFTGHKWLCGPEGVGGLYVSPEAMESLRPTFIGWRGVEVDGTGQPTGWKPDARRYEIATSAYPLYAGLTAAIELHRQWGTAEERYRQICRSSARLWEKLREIPGVTCLRTSPPESGLVSFTLDSGTHKNLVVFLEGRSIMTRTILDPSCVRACVHYLTSEEESDRLVESVREFTAQSGNS
ncbi:cysteine lyase [Leptolyngbya valderiana BDU 20041]|nr:aminotransferase class V-fold PLP-dependent enzyme [Geitlerinema sp. CS-897]OAB60840.1 cysteine lyase [Leptolyngbya valderiana BDU 20041]PPT07287.1 Cysteine desulfurase [Geitlerinema sp. FC II]